MSRSLLLGVRLGLALAVGAVVGLTALLAVWQEYASSFMGTPQWHTRRTIEPVDEKIFDFRRDWGRFPHDLAELDLHGSRISDGWGRPLVYEVTETGYALESLGRDGRPGGSGLDCDITGARPYPPEAFPSLQQFLFDMPSQGFVDSCLLSSVVAAVLAFLVFRRPRSWWKACTYVGAVALMSVGFSVVISVLHLPTGH